MVAMAPNVAYEICDTKDMGSNGYIQTITLRF
jgi:hypothetical protein